MVAYRIGVDLQDLGDLFGTPACAEQHDRLDAVGLALVARLAMGRAQFSQFLGAKCVVVHVPRVTQLQPLALDS